MTEMRGLCLHVLQIYIYECLSKKIDLIAHDLKKRKMNSHNQKNMEKVRKKLLSEILKVKKAYCWE
jgi:hypothetical protein